MNRTTLLTALISAATLAAAAPGAAAQSPNRPDPDSPAGAEYQLPLDQVRKDTGSAPKGNRSSEPGGTDDGSAAPLFGEGIEPESAGAPRVKGTQAAPKGRTRAASPEQGKSKVGGGDGADPTAALAAAIDGPDDGGGGLTIAAIAAAVLLVGALLGLTVRRFLGRPST